MNYSLKMTFAAIFLFTYVSYAQPTTTLTIYDNFALVNSDRTILFDKGQNTLNLTDIPSALNPRTLNFRCLSDPDAVKILEQTYRNDLLSTEAILGKYLRKQLTLTVRGSGADTGRQFTGTLLADLGDNLVLQTRQNAVEIINRGSIELVSLSSIPENLALKPTLSLLYDSKSAADRLCRISCQTAGLNWSADYQALINPDETTLSLSGRVTIENNSGLDYNDCSVKLVAGNVKTLQPEPLYARKAMMMEAAAQAPSQDFAQQAFMEYHLYTLDRKTSLPNQQQKQIDLITPASGITLQKLYVFDRQIRGDRVQTKIEFENKKQNHLGIPLPAGTIRVSKQNPSDGSAEFVGEDAIKHTARDEKVSLYIGDAFDIVPEYTLVASTSSRRTITETHKVELRNRKDKAVTVYVDEKFRSGVNWTIDNASHKYKKKDAYTARFEAVIDPNSAATVEYTATQNW